MVKRGPCVRPQASEGEAQHGPFCGTRRIGQGERLYRRDMDGNVLTAALWLDEPITFGRVEPLHDTGRHRTLSPFWHFDDTGTQHRIQDVTRHATRIAATLSCFSTGRRD